MTKSVQRQTAFAFGVIFVVVLLVLAMAVPNPTPFQYTVFRIVLSLAAAGVAAMIPGFIEVEVSGWVRAGGALAVFVIVFFYNPAAIVVPESRPAVLVQSMTNSPGGLQVGGDLQVNTDRRLTGEVATNFIASLNGKPCYVRVGVLGVGGDRIDLRTTSCSSRSAPDAGRKASFMALGSRHSMEYASST